MTFFGMRLTRRICTVDSSGCDTCYALSNSPVLRKGQEVAGVAGAVVDGGTDRLRHHQTDTYQHPEWSEEHKIARAGTKGTLTGIGHGRGAAPGASVVPPSGLLSGPFAPVGAVVGGSS